MLFSISLVTYIWIFWRLFSIPLLFFIPKCFLNASFSLYMISYILDDCHLNGLSYRRAFSFQLCFTFITLLLYSSFTLSGTHILPNGKHLSPSSSSSYTIEIRFFFRLFRFVVSFLNGVRSAYELKHIHISSSLTIIICVSVWALAHEWATPYVHASEIK